MARARDLVEEFARGIRAERGSPRTRAGKVASAVHAVVRDMERAGPLPPNAEWDAAITVGASMLAAAVVKQHGLPETPEMVQRVALYLAATMKGAAVHFELDKFTEFERATDGTVETPHTSAG